MSRVELFNQWDEEVQRTWRKPLSEGYRLRRDFVWAWRMFRLSRSYDAVITGSYRAELLFAMMERFAWSRRAPHIFIDWYCNLPGGGFGRW